MVAGGVAGELAGGDGAADVEGLLAAGGLEQGGLVGRAWSRSRASAASSSASTNVVPPTPMPGPGWVWWKVTCRPSAASAASRAAVSGMNRAMASEQSRSMVGSPTSWE